VNGIGSGEGDASRAAEVQRWTAGRKSAIVPDTIKGRATTVDAARLPGLTLAEVESWVDKFDEGGGAG
jgi:transposase-like protein